MVRDRTARIVLNALNARRISARNVISAVTVPRFVPNVKELAITVKPSAVDVANAKIMYGSALTAVRLAPTAVWSAEIVIPVKTA